MSGLSVQLLGWATIRWGPQCSRLRTWLEKLGMSEYTQRFSENGINVAALPHLTDQDLKDIGVLLGHGRIMLAAIKQAGRRNPGNA